MKKKINVQYVLFFVLIILFFSIHCSLYVQASSNFSQIKKSNQSIKFNGKKYYSSAANNDEWITEKEIIIPSGKFDWPKACVSAISCNDGLGDKNNPEIVDKLELGGNIITMVCSFISAGKSGISNIKLQLQSKGTDHRMLLMYGTPIEEMYRGQTLDLSTILINANKDSGSYVLRAKKDADKMIRKCFSGLTGDGKYDMKITFAKDFGKIPYKYSLIISNDGKMYAYPILHKGTKMEVYYKPNKGKAVFAFDATNLIKSEKLEVDEQIQKDITNYIQNNIENKRKSINLNKNKVIIYEKGKNTVQLEVNAKVKKNKVSWKSSNSRIARVNSKGKVSAKKAGTAIITATINGETAICNIIVKKVNITLPKEKTLKIDSKTTLKATVSGPSEKILWKSSNSKIVRVSSKGVVSAKKAGTVTITAKANGVVAKCKITVVNKSKPKVNYNKMYNEYKKIVLSSIDTYGRYDAFTLYDADGDKVPELYISNVKGSTEYAVYSFAGNKIKKIGKVNVGPWFYANPDGNGIVNTSAETIGVYKVTSSNVVQTAYYEWAYNEQANKRWNAAAKKYFTKKAGIPSSTEFGEVRTASECMKRFDKLIKPYMK